MVEHADEQAETTALIVATYTEALESGFYLLSGSISFEFRTENDYFSLSKVHEMFSLNYTDTTKEPTNIVLDVTNSLYIHENVGGFNVVMSATKFDGNEEPANFTGSSTNGCQSTFKSFEWSDDLHWNNI
jgi:hypothetical protein